MILVEKIRLLLWELILSRFLKTAILLCLAACTPSHFIAGQSGGVVAHLHLPDAEEVFFAASTDGFRPHLLERKGDGFWVAPVFADRTFRYFYIVDGRVYVPQCQYREKDDFGDSNCIYQP